MNQKDMTGTFDFGLESLFFIPLSLKLIVFFAAESKLSSSSLY